VSRTRSIRARCSTRSLDLERSAGEDRPILRPSMCVVTGETWSTAPRHRDEDEREKIAGEVLLITGSGVQCIRADRVLPGAQIVVPAARGGADKYGWKPEDTAPVSDLSLAARGPGLPGDPGKQPGARSARRRELVLVWTPDIARAWLGAGADASMRPLVDVLADPDATLADADVKLRSWFKENETALPADVCATIAGLTSRTPEWLTAGDEQFGLVLRDGRVTGEDLVEGRELQRTVPVSLVEHLRTVGELSETFARGVGLTESLVAALRLAGATHDLGKADPRFQRRLGAPEGELLAKSFTYDRSLPRGERHEVYSVAILDRHADIFAGGNTRRRRSPSSSDDGFVEASTCCRSRPSATTLSASSDDGFVEAGLVSLSVGNAAQSLRRLRTTASLKPWSRGS
jgi:hypothetical protein